MDAENRREWLVKLPVEFREMLVDGLLLLQKQEEEGVGAKAVTEDEPPSGEWPNRWKLMAEAVELAGWEVKRDPMSLREVSDLNMRFLGSLTAADRTKIVLELYRLVSFAQDMAKEGVHLEEARWALGALKALRTLGQAMGVQR